MQDLTRVDVADLPSVLKVREVAAVLRLPLSRAYQLVQEGQIPCVRFGRSVRVPRQVLVDLLTRASERREQ
ncbi:MAG: helix-turn-helix domain-containing protein [Bacillota bacterium]